MLVIQSCLILQPHGLQCTSALCPWNFPGILKLIAIPFSKASSPLRDQTWVSCFAGRFFNICTTREAQPNEENKINKISSPKSRKEGFFIILYESKGVLFCFVLFDKQEVCFEKQAESRYDDLQQSAAMGNLNSCDRKQGANVMC